MKIACISLGCPKNQVDLDVMVHILLSAGHETVADLAEADVILVNTCGFASSPLGGAAERSEAERVRPCGPVASLPVKKANRKNSKASLKREREYHPL